MGQSRPEETGSAAVARFRPRPEGRPRVSLYPVSPEPAIEEPGWSGPGAFPTPRTSFVGREDELARAAELVPRSRLMTLLGRGGGGKTRIAVATATGQRDRFTGGCFFADLGPLERGAR